MFLLALLMSTAHAHHFKNVKFIRNHDGDTIKVDIPSEGTFFGKEMPVRLYGIDTPEMASQNPCEKEKAILARDELNRILTKAAQINLNDVQKDKYFRLLAKVEADGIDLSYYLLSHGLAVRYFGDKKQQYDWCGSYPKLPKPNPVKIPLPEPKPEEVLKKFLEGKENEKE